MLRLVLLGTAGMILSAGAYAEDTSAGQTAAGVPVQRVLRRPDDRAAAPAG